MHRSAFPFCLYDVSLDAAEHDVCTQYGVVSCHWFEDRKILSARTQLLRPCAGERVTKIHWAGLGRFRVRGGCDDGGVRGGWLTMVGGGLSGWRWGRTQALDHWPHQTKPKLRGLTEPMVNHSLRSLSSQYTTAIRYAVFDNGTPQLEQVVRARGVWRMHCSWYIGSAAAAIYWKLQPLLTCGITDGVVVILAVVQSLCLSSTSPRESSSSVSASRCPGFCSQEKQNLSAAIPTSLLQRAPVAFRASPGCKTPIIPFIPSSTRQPLSGAVEILDILSLNWECLKRNPKPTAAVLHPDFNELRLVLPHFASLHLQKRSRFKRYFRS